MFRFAVFWFLPLMLFVFFIPQTLYVFYKYNDAIAFEILVLVIVSIFSMLLTQLFFLNQTPKKAMEFTKTFEIAALISIGLYIFAYMIMIIDYGGLPIIKFFTHGGYPNALRADFYKEKEGIVKLAVYLRSIIGKGFLPLFFAFLTYKKRTKLLKISLLLYVFLSGASFEKSMILWVFVPLFFYYFLSFDFKRFFSISIFLFVFIAAMSLLQLGDDYAYIDYGTSNTGEIVETKNRSDTRCYDNPKIGNEICLLFVSFRNINNYQLLLHSELGNTTSSFLINRIIWTPFITVYDTILYWYDNYDGQYIGMKFNRYLSSLFGEKFAKLERNVFRFQYGGGPNSTGNANASFFAEAYLINGLLTVVLFSSLIGILQGWVISSKNRAIMVSYLVYGYALISVSYISLLFSGGLIIYCFMVFLFTNRK